MRIATLLLLSALASSATAQTVIPVGEFRSVELRNGGHVTVRHGAVQRVSLAQGDLRYTRVRVDADQRLVIDDATDDATADATGSCPRDYRLEVEIVTPSLAAVSVSNGGRILAVGPFPAQRSINAAVEQGGSIDIRAIAATDVDAAVHQGGRIFATCLESLDATVRSGGGITYWGDPENVKKSVRGGGAVMRGTGVPGGEATPGF